MTRQRLYDWIHDWMMEFLAGMVSFSAAKRTAEAIIKCIEHGTPVGMSPQMTRRDPDVPYPLIDFLGLCDGHEIEDLTDDMVYAMIRVASIDGGQAYVARLERGERPQVGWLVRAMGNLRLL